MGRASRPYSITFHSKEQAFRKQLHQLQGRVTCILHNYWSSANVYVSCFRSRLPKFCVSERNQAPRRENRPREQIQAQQTRLSHSHLSLHLLLISALTDEESAHIDSFIPKNECTKRQLNWPKVSYIPFSYIITVIRRYCQTISS